ncbi:maleylacetoacetate isomerase [Sphingomonas sp.]|jgi:maleylpyruvate isomerase|uniref:maleylacetoacetate isomerase n=1 Tax=Sphingomonas sp. TaxID=28214 RepID=UPI0035C86562
MIEPVLHGYYRSTASWRVRIALNLKGIGYRDAFHHLARGAQHDPAFRRLNPQGFLPVLEADGAILTQSLAICEYLEDKCPTPPLLPGDAATRAAIRALAQIIACDTHPVQNLKVLTRLRALGLEEAQVIGWARDTIDDGLAAYDALLPPPSGDYSVGAQVTLADICLIPQLYNARRFGVSLRWPRLEAIEAACLEHEAFRRAAPEAQHDAE